MYPIRPYISENVQVDLPTTMYSVKPMLGETQKLTNDSVIKEIEHRQDILLEQIDTLYNQLINYKNQEDMILLTKTIRKEFVIHLSAKQPSKNILKFMEDFHDKLNIRTFRHSSLTDSAFKDPLEKLCSTNDKAGRSLAIIWSDGGNLPYMFYSKLKFSDEQTIIDQLKKDSEL